MTRDEATLKVYKSLPKWVPMFKSRTMSNTGLSTDDIIDELITSLIYDGTLIDQLCKGHMSPDEQDRYIATAVRNAMHDLQASRTKEAKMFEHYDAPKGEGTNNASAGLDAVGNEAADFGDMDESADDSADDSMAGDDTAFTPEAVEGADVNEIGDEDEEDPHAELAEVESQIETIQQTLLDMEDKGEDNTPEYHAAYKQMKELFARRKELEAAGGDELALERVNAKVDALSEQLMEMEDNGEEGSSEYKHLREKWKSALAQQKALKSRTSEMTTATKRTHSMSDLRNGNWDEDTKKFFTDKWNKMNMDERNQAFQVLNNTNTEKGHINQEFRKALNDIINKSNTVKIQNEEGEEAQEAGIQGGLAMVANGFDQEELLRQIATVIKDKFYLNGPRAERFPKDRDHYRDFRGGIELGSKEIVAKYCDGKKVSQALYDVLNNTLDEYLKANVEGEIQEGLYKCAPYSTKIVFEKLVKIA